MIAWLKLHGFEDMTDAEIAQSITFSVAELCRFRKWEFMDTVATVAVAQGISTVLTGVGTVHSVYDDTNNHRLVPYADSDFVDMAAGNLTELGVPLWYQVLAGSLMVFPGASTALSLRVVTTAAPPTISASSTEAQFVVPAQHHEVIAYGALYRLYALNDDTENVTIFKQLFEQGRDQMVYDVSVTNVDRFPFVQDVVGYD